MGSGVRILSMEERISSKPMIRIATETRSPEIYSMRPCPKGCSVSGFCPESLKPTRVITEEPASDKLLKASAVMVIEPLRIPASHFPIKRKMFKAIPTAPQSMP